MRISDWSSDVCSSDLLSTVTYALGHRVARQNRQLERLNRIDVLTGLPNRRHWDEVADGELARYLRSRRPAVVMLIDVDNFKEVNDAHGHGTGDEVLRCVRSEEHTSELQSLMRISYAVFCLKKHNNTRHLSHHAPHKKDSLKSY